MNDTPPRMIEIELVKDVIHNGREVEAGSLIYLAEDKARPMIDNGWARPTKRPRPRQSNLPFLENRR